MKTLLQCRPRLFVFLFLTLLLAGCVNPTFLTKHHDDTYQERSSSFEMILVQGNFRGAEGILHSSGFDNAEGYSNLAKRMEQNFQHNDVSLTSRIVKYTSKEAAQLEASKINLPVLLFFPEKLIVKNGSPLSFTIRASLYIPGRNAEVWNGFTVVFINQAADDISLKTLNELSKLGLLKMKSPAAETIDGKSKAIFFGGVLTK